jgi:hypothetical protein
MATAFTDTYRTVRLARNHNGHTAVTKPVRTPILIVLAGLLARWMPAPEQVRRVVLSVAGFGAITVAAWMIAVPLGLLVGGFALLVLEALSSPGGT